MTASEKLRALEAEAAIVVVSLDPTPLHVVGEPAPASVTLRNALPLIADVVEAAEKAHAILPKSAGSVTEWNSIDMIEKSLAHALIALRDHLENK